MPFGASHDIILTLAVWSLQSFYRDIKVAGYENVPKEGPAIVCSTHSNMAVDPAVLSYTFPHKRKIHYWAKNSLFANPIVGAIFLHAGVVPVDRSTRNNQQLFAATFEVLKQGEVVAVFPEGTSHSESRLLQLKDGASWAALEYMKYISDTEESDGQSSTSSGNTSKKLAIVPAGITYVHKSKYRSLAIAEYGSPIDASQYVEDFRKDPRNTVKILTKQITEGMEKVTINAPNWEILNAAHMTRKFLFCNDNAVALEDYVKITQRLISFFVTNTSDEVDALQRHLNQYKSNLESLHLSNADITHYENRELNLQWTAYKFFKELTKSLVQLPFFLPGLAFHWPIYVIGKISAKLEKYEESRAQNKMVLGLAWLTITYLFLFFTIWVMMLFTPLGFVLAAGAVIIFAWYHVALVDSHYDTFKDLISSYRLFSALASGKGSASYEQVEGLVASRRTCLTYLRRVIEEYRDKSDDLKCVLEYQARDESKKTQ